MYKYTVKPAKQNRMAFRGLGLILIMVSSMEISMFLVGYGREHIIITVLCVLLLIYGFYLIAHSFKKQSYDITYEFLEDEIKITHFRGVSTYSYADVKDVSVVVPEDAITYCLIHLVINKESFVIPFSFKKEKCDQIYSYILAKSTLSEVNQEEDSHTTEG